ncbi:arginine-tRNA-protein transferase [Colwellia chukchiensis]|uniref:Aspartate/glutamate leucyltransferase n=1 Tax=Colwellia chukchiensis TaxID=641665 RepID=A0A1H7SNT2_9GAMM|nr:arginyltransferase [Colwellia chukchiensis]SEL74300.1 arginine-tRNA-protein transferase [Colwellia chukchiensis]
MSLNFQLGVTKSFPCSYLPEQQERLLVALDSRLSDSEHYAWLMEQGFRRSGNDIYRPHCLNCNACQSLRVLVNDFQPSKSQKRTLKRNQALHVEVSETVKANYYPLFEQYIDCFHRDGAMYPASAAQFQRMLANNITKQCYLEVWHQTTLVSVAITDKMPNALSAVYTFYHPAYRSQGLGVFSILQQIKLASELKRRFLYLGYQIDQCAKMNYKNRFHPHQRLIENQWQTVNK